MQPSTFPTRSSEPAIDGRSGLATALAFDQEQLFRTLFQSAPIGVIMTEAHSGRAVLVNDRMVRLLGYTREELLQLTSRDFTHPDDRQANHDLYQKLLHGESGECIFQKRYLRKDGEVVWARSTMIPLRLSPAAPLYVLAAVEDVTASRRAEQQLRESEQRFRIVTEASPIMVWMAGTDKLCYYFNPGWLEYVGRTLEQEAGNGWAENVHPDDFDRCLNIYVTNFDLRQPFEMHYRLRHHTGQYRWILDHGVPRFDADGNFEGYIGGCLDIHDQVEAAEKVRLAADMLQRNKERLEVALAASETGTFQWDPASREFLEFDENLKRLLLIPTDRPVKTLADFLQHIHPDDVSAVAQAMDHCCDTGAIDLEFRVLLPDGSIRWLSDRARVQRNADGKPAHLTGACTNITARKKAEEALRRTEKLAATGRLAATVAHEINNPLASVTNLLYLVTKDPDLTDISRHRVQLAEQEIERIAYFAKQTLGLYRESAPPAWQDASQLINDVLQTYGSRVQNRDAVLQLEIDEGARAFVVAGEFRQVLSNLLINAIDALPTAGGRIRIRAEAVHDYSHPERTGLRLTIADNGCGIAPEHLTKIFEPFYTTKFEVGTGLGLWFSKNVVEKYKGKLGVRSRTSGPLHGTTFSVFWPDPLSA